MSYRTRGQSSKVTALSDESKENTTPKRRGRPKKNNDIPEASPPKRAKATNGRRQVTTNDAEEISVSAIGCLPERERETEDLAKYIEDILSENGSGSLYISGPPGTGKTATLTRIISDQKLASKLNMVYVNCTSISTAGGIYKKICEGLKLSVGGTTEKFYLVAIEEYLKKKHREDCLVAIKLLSRDKTYLNETVREQQLACLLGLAGIGGESCQCRASEEVQVEALKCLSNLIFQSSKCQELCLNNSSTEGIMRRIKTYKDGNVCYDIRYFDMKLLFLLTAINCDIRAKVREELHGLVYLVETLDLFMGQAAEAKEFSDKDLELINEVLKVLFNLTVRTPLNAVPEEEEANQFHRLAVVVHDLFFYRTLNRDKIISLQSNIVNLLTSVPVSCYSELVSPLNPEDLNSKTVVPFEGKNVYVLHVLVEFLRRVFQKSEKKSDQYELLSPILTVLIKTIRATALNRRYVRSEVLPPLKNVKERPEVGTELRNYLCSLLTSPITQIADLSAELLFVLCKENVGRMIKYTGYGNAAGLFANRGLLGGRQGNTEQYSSDSEDSDTEEYKQIQHAINPVLGCYEPPKPNPLEGMSEEQKEYEAMQLVALMDKLQRQGIVQPCKIGEDGRPQPVDHIMELQDEIPEQQRDHKRKT